MTSEFTTLQALFIVQIMQILIANVGYQNERVGGVWVNSIFKHHRAAHV
jgi:hypothetical protein